MPTTMIMDLAQNGSEIGKLLLDFDWSRHSLREPSDWPQSLRTTVETMLASQHGLMIAWGPKLTLLYNDAYAPFLGMKHPWALGRPFKEVWSDIWADIEPMVDQAMSGKAIWLEDYHLVMERNGYPEDTWWQFSYSPLRDESGEIAGMLNVTSEMTAKVVAEKRLRELNEDLEARVAERTHDRNALWQLSRDIMLRSTFEGVITSVNPAWEEVLGWREEELVGSSLFDFIHPADLEYTIAGARELSKGIGHARFDNRYKHKDGTYRWISWTTRSGDGMINAVGRDFTLERERDDALQHAEEALRQAQKMEAVGQLTGGLAHDFNNLLAAISGAFEMIGLRLASGRVADVERYLGAGQEATKRAAALTHRLLAFSRRQTLAPQPVDVNVLVGDLEDLLQRTVGPDVEIRIFGADNLWPALADPSQLENAVLNLCINARHAMPHGGRITIETSNRHLDAAAAAQRDMAAGDYLSLSVSDNGVGMSADVIAKAFDPFFTTKPIGEGTGLGLSMIYGFAKQSDGQVRIHSQVGEGTTVTILLPRHHGKAEMPTKGLSQPPRPEGAGETVLVVDDEPSVRMLVTDVLAELGYGALEAGDGAAGIEVLESGAHIDLLITDVGLPGGMNGRQLADVARQSRPDLSILFITGYAENAVLDHQKLEPGMRILTKPFTVDGLASCVKETLAASAQR